VSSLMIRCGLAFQCRVTNSIPSFMSSSSGLRAMIYGINSLNALKVSFGLSSLFFGVDQTMDSDTSKSLMNILVSCGLSMKTRFSFGPQRFP
jgi:hypothetical protein